MQTPPQLMVSGGLNWRELTKSDSSRLLRNRRSCGYLTSMTSGANLVIMISMNWIYWLPTLAFLIHVIEEFGRFPSWVSRHFGRTSRAWYVYSHIVLITFFIASSWFAASAPPISLWTFVAVGLQWVICGNAFFHLFVTFWFREYSPGVVTGTLVVIPSTLGFARNAPVIGLMTGAEWAIILSASVLVNTLVIASLWLNFDIDWRWRKNSKGGQDEPKTK